jgi:hypothetical protein
MSQRRLAIDQRVLAGGSRSNSASTTTTTTGRARHNSTDWHFESLKRVSRGRCRMTISPRYMRSPLQTVQMSSRACRLRPDPTSRCGLFAETHSAPCIAVVPASSCYYMYIYVCYYMYIYTVYMYCIYVLYMYDSNYREFVGGGSIDGSSSSRVT